MAKAGRARSRRPSNSCAGATPPRFGNQTAINTLSPRWRSPRSQCPPRGVRWGPFLSPACRLGHPPIWAAGTFSPLRRFGVGVTHGEDEPLRERHMNGLIYLIGLIVVILAILSFFGLR